MINSVSIVIPNWNGSDLIRKNIGKLIPVFEKDKVVLEIIISDDASTDDSVALLKDLKAKSKKLILIVNKKNLGFASNVNRAVALARGKYVYLLNTDTFPKTGFLKPIIECFKKDEALFAVGSAYKYRWSRVSFTGGYVNIPLPGIIQGNESLQQSAWVSGGQSAFDRKKWTELKGLDPVYNPFYWEELDLCYRAWKRGYKVLWCPESQVKHLNKKGVIRKNFSKKYIDFIAERNQLLFIWKNISDWQMRFYHLLAVIGRVVGGPGYIKVVFASIKRYFQFRPEKRKREVRTDREIFELFKS